MFQAGLRQSREMSTGAARLAWLSLGYVFFALGAVGMVLPLMPTTVFWILAAGCFAKSSQRMHAYIMRCPVVGPAVGEFLDHGIMPRRAKYFALGGMALGLGLMLAGGLPPVALMLAVAVLALSALYVIRRPEHVPVPLRRRGPRG